MCDFRLEEPANDQRREGEAGTACLQHSSAPSACQFRQVWMHLVLVAPGHHSAPLMAMVMVRASQRRSRGAFSSSRMVKVSSGLYLALMFAFGSGGHVHRATGLSGARGRS